MQAGLDLPFKGGKVSSPRTPICNYYSSTMFTLYTDENKHNRQRRKQTIARDKQQPTVYWDWFSYR